MFKFIKNLFVSNKTEEEKELERITDQIKNRLKILEEVFNNSLYRLYLHRLPCRVFLGFFKEYDDDAAIHHIMALVSGDDIKKSPRVFDPYDIARSNYLNKDRKAFIRMMSNNPLMWFADLSTIYSGTSHGALSIQLKLRDTEINTKYPVDIDRFMELVDNRQPTEHTLEAVVMK